jgi:nucleotide-binding universal stress UspA family protein
MYPARIRVMAAPRILVPTDLSECSKTALEYALFVAEKTEAEVTLMHVVEPMRYITPDVAIGAPGDVGLPYKEFSERYFEEELRALVKDTDRAGVGPTVETAHGIAHEVITRRGEDFDLIIMGTHGRSGFQNLVTGSVAGRVVRSAPCPVATVREEVGKQAKKLDRILVAVDPGDASKPALKGAKEVAQLLGAELEALYVWEPLPWLRANLSISHGVSMNPKEFEEYSQKEALRSAQDFVAEVAGPDVKVSLKVGSPAEATVEFAQKGNFDLLVIGTHGREGFTRLLLGSVAEKVVRACPIPVMSIHGS